MTRNIESERRRQLAMIYRQSARSEWRRFSIARVAGRRDRKVVEQL